MVGQKPVCKLKTSHHTPFSHTTFFVNTHTQYTKRAGWLLLGLAACSCTKQQSDDNQPADTVAARPVAAAPEKKANPALVGIIQRLPLVKPEYKDTVRWNTRRRMIL
jgi:hypothetical protein